MGLLPACLVTISLLMGAAQGRGITSFAGPFIVYVERIGGCPDFDDGSIHIRSTHFNPLRPFDKQRITGNVTNTYETNDKMWMHVQVDIRSNNQWKQNYFILKFPRGACSTLRRNSRDYYRVMYKLDPDKQGPCIIPAGVYVVDDAPISWDYGSIPVFPYGHYRCIAKLGREPNKALACYEVIVKIIPRPD